MLRGLSSTYCILDSGFHTDIVASIAPKGTPKGKQKRRSEREKENVKEKRDETKKGKNRFSNNPHTGSGSTALSADAAPPRGTEQAIQTTNNKNKAQGSRSSLRLRKQVLPTIRPGALLPCLQSPCFLHQRFFWSPNPPFGFVLCAPGLRGASISYVPPLRAT